MSAKAVVREYLQETLPAAEARVPDDVSLFGRGILDSVGVLELVAHLEHAFHIRVTDAELGPQNFDNLNAIQSFVDRKRAAV